MLAELNYRNLDDEPAFAGHEHLDRGAGPGGRRPAGRAGARRRARRGRARARRARRHAARVARRLGQLRAAAVTDGPRRLPDGIDDPARPERRQHATTAASATGWPRSAGRCTSTRCRGVAAPDADRLAASPRSLARCPDGAVVLVDGLVASAAPEVLVPAGAPAAPGRARAPAARRRPASARCSRPPPRVVTTSDWTRRRLLERYALPRRPGARRDARASTRAELGARDRRRRAAALRRRGHAAQGPRRAGRRAGDARRPAVALRVRRAALDRDPAFVDGCAAVADAGSPTGCASPGPRTGAELDRRYAAADLLVLPSRGGDVRDGGHRGAGPRRCRCSRPTSAGCRRRSATAPTGPAGAAGPARTTRRRWPPRCGAGSTTPSCARGCAGRPRAARDAARLATTTAVVAGVAGAR